MDKEALIRDLIVSLKVAFRNASIYNPEHPAFVESIDALKGKIDDLFEFIIPISIGFTPRSLYIDGSFYKKEKIYQELAKLFHYRKIKAVEIEREISKEEITSFITLMGLPAKEVIKEGGPSDKIEKAGIRNITVEELDYAELLKGEGEEIKDIWPRLLQEALNENDQEKILELADNFDKMIKEYSTQEIKDSSDLREALKRFLGYLKDHENTKFIACSKDFIKSVLRHKDVTPDDPLGELLPITAGLLEEDYAMTLWEEIVADENFEPLNLNIFSKFVEKKKEERVNFYVSKIFNANPALRDSLDVGEKIKDLLTAPDTDLVSGIYRKTLDMILQQLSWESDVQFDYPVLYQNYRFILIQLFKAEEQEKDAIDLLQKIHMNWEKIIEGRDYEFLKILYDSLKEKKDVLGSVPAFIDLESQTCRFIEEAILDGELSLYFEYFIDSFEKSRFDVNVYLERIFTEGKVTPYLFKAYFKFHREYLFYFNLNLENYAADSGLMEKIIECLKMIDTRVSFVTLKTIFTLGNTRIKRKVLGAMQELSIYDESFLFPIMEGKEAALKAEALVILMKDEDTRKKAFERLFLMPSPFGIRNRRIMENIAIVYNKDLISAEPYLATLSGRKFFWNSKIRTAAQKVREKWNAT